MRLLFVVQTLDGDFFDVAVTVRADPLAVDQLLQSGRAARALVHRVDRTHNYSCAFVAHLAGLRDSMVQLGVPIAGYIHVVGARFTHPMRAN